MKLPNCVSAKLNREASSKIVQPDYLSKPPRSHFRDNRIGDRIDLSIPAVTQSEYRRDIDGLRAIAVLLVVGFHAFPEWLHGGFIGVDVFFVISGYLITGIILRSLKDGTFSLQNFYARRVRRIFPALLTVLVACFVFGWYWLLPSELRELAIHMLAGAGFVSNFVLWGESGYFDKAAELKPLLHLWSLGIEEQFYILWPIALVVVAKSKLNLRYFFLVTIAISLGLSLLLASKAPMAGFYSPFARFWELASGGFLAWSCRPSGAAISFKRMVFDQCLAVIGISLIVAGLFFINQSKVYPGAWALFPVTGTLFLLAAGEKTWVNHLVLSNKPMVYLGLLSYPLYLWHWPMLAMARVVSPAPLSTEISSLLVLLSLTGAYITFRYIETPIRQRHSVSGLTAYLLAAMGLVAVAAGITAVNGGFASRLGAPLQPFAMFKADFQVDGRTGLCWVSSNAVPDAFAQVCVDQSPNLKPLVAVWGDSHAARLFPGIQAQVADGARLAQWTRDACPPILDYSDEHCIAGNQFVLDQIKRLKPEVLVVFAAWNRYQGQTPGSFPIAEFHMTLDKLRELGIPKLVVVGPAPQWKSDLPNAMVRYAWNNDVNAIPSRTYQGFETSAQSANQQMLSSFGAIPGVAYFSVLSALCDVTGCITTLTGDASGLTTWDYGHLSTPAARFVAGKLAGAGLLSFPER